MTVIQDLRMLALGDSYTIGEGVREEERWPVRLAALLREQGIGVAPPTIVAKTGWTTDELDAGIDAAGLSGTYDLVTLLIGVNDQYRGQSVGDYRPRFRALLERAIGFGGGRPGRVIVVAIPDWGVTPFAAGRDRDAIGRTIDAFNAANREEASRAGAKYADIAAVTRRAASDETLIANDGLHPSGTMYDEWARLILPIARATL